MARMTKREIRDVKAARVAAGLRIRHAREALKLSQRALALKLKVKQSDVSAWERGQTRLPAAVVPVLVKDYGVGRTLLEKAAQALPAGGRRRLAMAATRSPKASHAASEAKAGFGASTHVRLALVGQGMAEVTVAVRVADLLTVLLSAVTK